MKTYNSIREAHEEQQIINRLPDSELRKIVGNDKATHLSLEGAFPKDYHLAIRGPGHVKLGVFEG